VRISESARCTAPAETVWSCVADPATRLRSHAEVVRERRLLEDGEALVAIVVGSHREEMRLRVVESEPPSGPGPGRLIEERVDGERQGRTVYEVVDEGGGARLTITAETKLPFLIEALASKPLRAALREQLANLCRESGG
jgi:carbon monoxide dehydrogenase subunit G